MNTKVNNSLHNNKLSNDELQKTVAAIMSFSSREEQAEYLGISRQALHKRLVNYPEIKDFAVEVTKATQISLLIYSLKAAENLVSLLNSKDEKVSLQASIEILNRVGLTTGSKEALETLPRPIMDVAVEDANNSGYRD